MSTAQIERALVLAAGVGSRLRSTDRLPKPLTPVAGKPLLERTLLTLAAGGIREAVVVVGFAKELVCSVLKADGELARTGLRVRVVVNDRYELSNGVSVLAAEGSQRSLT